MSFFLGAHDVLVSIREREEGDEYFPSSTSPTLYMKS